MSTPHVEPLNDQKLSNFTCVSKDFVQSSDWPYEKLQFVNLHNDKTMQEKPVFPDI